MLKFQRNSICAESFLFFRLLRSWRWMPHKRVCMPLLFFIIFIISFSSSFPNSFSWIARLRRRLHIFLYSSSIQVPNNFLCSHVYLYLCHLLNIHIMRTIFLFLCLMCHFSGIKFEIKLFCVYKLCYWNVPLASNTFIDVWKAMSYFTCTPVSIIYFFLSTWLIWSNCFIKVIDVRKYLSVL